MIFSLELLSDLRRSFKTRVFFFQNCFVFLWIWWIAFVYFRCLATGCDGDGVRRRTRIQPGSRLLGSCRRVKVQIHPPDRRRAPYEGDIVSQAYCSPTMVAVQEAGRLGEGRPSSCRLITRIPLHWNSTSRPSFKDMVHRARGSQPFQTCAPINKQSESPWPVEYATFPMWELCTRTEQIKNNIW